MSTTFRVYPCAETIPSFEQLLLVANGHLNTFLHSYGIDKYFALAVGMRIGSNQVLPLELTDKVWWPKAQYAWFSIPGVAGGTEAYAVVINDLHRDILANDISQRKGGTFSKPAEQSSQIGRYWYFRRSVGNPAIINIAYGVLAASLAELTSGFLDSDDVAWDPQLLPARPDEFLAYYFRPEVTEDASKKEWAERGLRHILEELNPNTPVVEASSLLVQTAVKVPVDILWSFTGCRYPVGLS